MTLMDFLGELEHRAAEAERIGAQAPVASIYRAVLGELRALDDGKHSTPPAVGDDGTLLTAREVAQRLGCSIRYVYSHAGDYPFTRRLGDRMVRFDREGLGRWLARVQQ